MVDHGSSVPDAEGVRSVDEEPHESSCEAEEEDPEPDLSLLPLDPPRELSELLLLTPVDHHGPDVEENFLGEGTCGDVGRLLLHNLLRLHGGDE